MRIRWMRIPRLAFFMPSKKISDSSSHSDNRHILPDFVFSHLPVPSKRYEFASMQHRSVIDG
jgi:hypothetical protein